MVGQFTYEDAVDGKIIKSTEHGLWMIFVSAVVMYALMGMGRKKEEDDFREYEHLPKRFRIRKYIDTALESFRMFSGYNVKIDKKVLYKDEEVIENWVYKYLSVYYANDSCSVEYNVEELDEEHEEYYAQVEVFYLLELSRLLDGFSYFKVIANEYTQEMEEALLRSILNERLGQGQWEVVMSDGRKLH